MKTWQNSKLKMWQNSETEIVNKLKMENVAKRLKIWQNSKTQNETKLYNSICDWNYTLKMWQNLKAQMWQKKIKNSKCDTT